MAAAVALRNVVRVAQDMLLIRIVPAQSDFDFDSGALAAARKRLFVRRRFAAVQKFDISQNPALEAKQIAAIGALVAQLDRQAGIQKRQLAQTARKNLVMKIDGAENLDIGEKSHFGAVFLAAPFLASGDTTRPRENVMRCARAAGAARRASVFRTAR